MIVDVDCVVADFIGAVLNIVDEEDRSVATHYNWWETVYTKKEADLINHILATSAWFWQNLPLMPDAIEGVEWLRSHGHYIHWVTAPYRSKYGWADDRRIFLNKHFKIRDRKDGMTFTHEKWTVKDRFFLDDHVDWVDAWEKNNRDGLGLLFKSEMNEKSTRKRVVWKDVMKMKFLTRQGI
jgi:hypothetical protein